MKYLEKFKFYGARVKFYEYTDSNLLNTILNKVVESFHGYKCSIENYLDEPTNPYWFTCKFKAKSGIDAANKIYDYKIFLKEKKEQLEKLPEIENVNYQCKGRTSPMKPEGKYANYLKAGNIIFEFKVQLTEQAFNDVQLEIEYHKNAKKYNL